MRKKLNAIAVVTALIFLITMLYSMFFIAQNTHHDCTNENCPICEQLQMAESMVQRVSAVILVVVSSIFVYILANNFKYVYEHIITFISPIKLKVKLLN